MWRTGLIIFVLTTVIFLGNGRAYSDEILEAINEAAEAYKEKDFTEAVEGLDYAKQLIQQLRSDKILKFLPEPFSGWESKSGKSQNMGILGGMAGVQREYWQPGKGSTGRKRITISIMGESPIMQGMMAVFNPMYATASGGRLQKIKRNKAVVKYDPERRSGDISVLVKKRFIVSIKGTSVDEKDMMDYAKAVDYKGLKEF